MPFYQTYGYEKNSRYIVPPTHFVMMGLKGPAGRYNEAEFRYTTSFPGEKAKKRSQLGKD
ncbi:hypothetical protein MFLO_14662 [Listeria floridensis FSL S10-1187]|uniref:Uncharacterized protein n=1 Tax=Listeria floridensis FSL S10-1187 TaxID=1265817 RepID=A0ABN0RBW9_9LIST|nr:hypothetical protein MFLO_14662 [Listeria floridensis FSL S10-1187]